MGEDILNDQSLTYRRSAAVFRAAESAAAVTQVPMASELVMRCGWSPTQPRSVLNLPLRRGGILERFFHGWAMGNKWRQYAPQNFLVMGVTDCLLSELDRMGFG